MNTLDWLMEWYKSNCDGDWEHSYGVKIDNVDNPGWSVNIDLVDTLLEDKPFQEIQFDNGDEDWMFCIKKNNAFIGGGDSYKLKRILDIFKEWTES